MPSRLRRHSLLLALILVAALAAPASAADNVAGPFLTDLPPIYGSTRGESLSLFLFLRQDGRR